MTMSQRTLAGVDGCKGGWIAVIERPQTELSCAVVKSFHDLLSLLGDDALVVVDMPIGLPDFIGAAGRGPERLLRLVLGDRKSSVFSIPSRQAVYTPNVAPVGMPAILAAHRASSAMARRTSYPERGVSIQAFSIFSKVRELDELLRSNPFLSRRVFESHPELAFWRLNGECPIRHGKKLRGRVDPDGMMERRNLLVSNGIPQTFLEMPAPGGSAVDDFVDACALLIVASHIATGEGKSLPDPPMRDAYGIPIAIWC